MSPDSVLAIERPAPPAVIGSDLMLARAAVTALHDELQAYPKPGLVSPIDSGAHADMDFALMGRSADSLLKPFASLAAAGREGRAFEHKSVAQRAPVIGMQVLQSIAQRVLVLAIPLCAVSQQRFSLPS